MDSLCNEIYSLFQMSLTVLCCNCSCSYVLFCLFTELEIEHKALQLSYIPKFSEQDDKLTELSIWKHSLVIIYTVTLSLLLFIRCHGA